MPNVKRDSLASVTRKGVLTMQEEPKEQPKQEEPKEQPKQEAQKTFTREELGKIVKAQLAEERKQWEQAHAGELEKAKEEGKTEANMTAKELAEKQAKEREEQFKKQQAELEQRQKELDHRDYIAHTKDLLAEEHLPTEGAEMLLGETEEETKKNIESFKELVDQGVRNALHKSSAGKAPQIGAPAQQEAPKKDMSEMTYEEMQKYIEQQEQL